MSKGKRYNANRHPAMKGYIYLSSFVILLSMLILLVWSFNPRWTFPDVIPDAWTLEGYRSVFFDRDFIGAVGTSFVITGAVCLVSIIVATLTARALVFFDFVGKNFIDFLVYLPCMVPAVSFTIAVNALFISWGLDGTVIGVIIVQVALCVPYAIKIVTNAMRLLGSRIEEQAVVLGSSPIKAFFQVEFHYLLPSLVSAACIVFVMSFNTYFATFMLGKGQVTTLAVQLFPLVTSPETMKAAVSGIVYVVLSMAFFFLLEAISNAILKRQRLYFDTE